MPGQPTPQHVALAGRLALHAWTLDQVPLADVFRVAARTGWRAVEARYGDLARVVAAGGSAEDLATVARETGLAVAVVSVEHGWMFAEGAERARLFEGIADRCRWAKVLGCGLVMSPVDLGGGDMGQAVARVREAADLVAGHGLRLALEPIFRSARFSRLGATRELLARAGHPRCALALDTYHFQRAGDDLVALEDVTAGELGHVQYSDVPASGLDPVKSLDRLPPGLGVVPFREIFALLGQKGYDGWLSYEAPNPAAWARPAEDVAREALAATRALLLPGVADK